MIGMRKFLPILVLPLLAAGCSTVTNLTPHQQERTSNNWYPVEMKWLSKEHALKPETVQAQVVVGTNSYPMQATPLVRNRWEAQVPVPPNDATVRYHYRIDYQVSGIPKPYAESKLSPEYKMQIRDAK